jgi:hypothetical protein
MYSPPSEQQRHLDEEEQKQPAAAAGHSASRSSADSARASSAAAPVALPSASTVVSDACTLLAAPAGCTDEATSVETAVASSAEQAGKLKQPGWVLLSELRGAPLSDTMRELEAVALREDGVFYCGPISDSTRLPHGKGETFWPNGALQSKGTFANGLLKDRGAYYSQDGTSMYMGNFERGVPEGAGCLVLRSSDEPTAVGRAYEGQFRDGKRDGFGVQWNKDEKHEDGRPKDGKPEHCGLWENDRLVEERPVPRGQLSADGMLLTSFLRAADSNVLLLPQGGCYIGQINAESLPHGSGDLHNSDGSVFLSATKWRNGKIQSRAVQPKKGAGPLKRVACACVIC